MALPSLVKNGPIAETDTTRPGGQPHAAEVAEQSPTWHAVARILVSLALLGLLVWTLPDFDVGELLPDPDAATAWWLAASLVTLIVAFVLQTARWDAVLRPMGHHVPFPRLFSEFMAGQFVSNVLPTAFAGDVIRIARLGHDLRDVPVAFASIALERLTGWLVLPAISLVTIAVTPELRSLGAATWTAVSINLVTLVALVAVLAVAANRRWDGAARRARGWRRWLGAIHLGIDAIRRHPGAVANIAVVGLAFQIVQCLSIWMAAKALHMDAVTVAAALAFFPPTLISQNLPVGFGGLGVREAGFILFFGALGAADERAIALGLVTYLITVVASAIGAPFLAVRGKRWREVLVEAEQETLEVELHDDADASPPSGAVT